MEEVEITLNNFLFNSGVLGFYKIMENSNKLHLIKEEGNVLKVSKEAFQNFEDDYINAMLHTFEKDTKWHSITESKERILNLDLSKEEDIKKLEDSYKFIKKSMESASYKAGYEIAKMKDAENPYEYIARVKVENTAEVMKENSIKIIEYLKKHKEIFCMKDIIYNKIQMYWESVSFLNRTANTKDIKEEYKKTFVTPAQEYLDKRKSSEYNCIECGNEVSKSDAFSMSWLRDTGVDINRKKSGFWNFKENAFICPICNLIYSCVPLGFTIVGDNSIFINQKNSIKELRQNNGVVEAQMASEEQSLEKIQNALFINLINEFKNVSNEKTYRNEVYNIQVIKRKKIDKDKVIYEFNLISKDKLNAFSKSQYDFEKLVNKVIYINKEPFSIYEEVLSNFLKSQNQYKLLDRLINEAENNSANISYIRSYIKNTSK